MPARPRFFRNWVNLQVRLLKYYGRYRYIVAPLIADPALLAALDLVLANINVIEALNDPGPN